MIDARTQHDPALAPGLIQKCLEIVKTQKELAGRLGVSRVYIQLLAKRQKTMSYGIQVMLERIIDESQ